MWFSTFHRSNKILISTHHRIHFPKFVNFQDSPETTFFLIWHENLFLYTQYILYPRYLIPPILYSHDIFALIWEPQHQNHLHIHAFVLIWIRNDLAPRHILPRYAASHIIKISNAKYQMQNINMRTKSSKYQTLVMIPFLACWLRSFHFASKHTHEISNESKSMPWLIIIWQKTLFFRGNPQLFRCI